MYRLMIAAACLGSLLLTLPAPCFCAQENVLTLEEAVDMAVQNHYRIREAAEKQLAAHQEIKSARADFLPKASATYSYMNIKEKPFQKMGAMSMQTADRTQFHWDISLIQPLFKGFALTSKYEMTKLQDAMREEEKHQAILDIARDVKQTYFTVLLSQKMVAVAEDEVEALTAQSDDAQRFFDQGLIPRNDLLRSQVALANARQNREKARADERLNLSRLNTLLVREIDHPTVVRDIDTLPGEPGDRGTLVKESMEKRPVLKITRLGIDTLETGITLARSAYYPELSLAGRYEENGDDFEISNNDFNNRHNAFVLVEARWTFFEWGKTRADVAKARHDREALINRLKEIEDGVSLEITNALLSLGVAWANIETAEKALEQAQENWRITKLQYDQQMVTSSDVLDARSYLTQADSNFYRARYGYLIALADLDRAVGRR
ncbi:MAG: TolC family protein [Deltaproteobacteria bacterium]|nr:TolC family protein [Deltaproteobacteria bacterium]